MEKMRMHYFRVYPTGNCAYVQLTYVINVKEDEEKILGCYLKKEWVEEAAEKYFIKYLKKDNLDQYMILYSTQIPKVFFKE